MEPAGRDFGTADLADDALAVRLNAFGSPIVPHAESADRAQLLFGPVSSPLRGERESRRKFLAGARYEGLPATGYRLGETLHFQHFLGEKPMHRALVPMGDPARPLSLKCGPGRGCL